MKTIFLILPVLGFATLAASGQVSNARNLRSAPGGGLQGVTAGNLGGAEYAAVSMAPTGNGTAANQPMTRRGARRQARAQRRAEYVAVSVAPQR